MSRLKNEIVQGYIDKWRERLGLHGWAIIWEWKSQAECASEIGHGATRAVTRRYSSTQSAKVWFNEEVPWTEEFHPAEDDEKPCIEECVIHELLHLRLTPQEYRVIDAVNDANKELSPISVAALNNATAEAREQYIHTISSLLLEAETWN